MIFSVYKTGYIVWVTNARKDMEYYEHGHTSKH